MFSGSSFSPASFSALAWLLDQIITQATASLQTGGGLKTRRRISTQPAWLPAAKTDDDEALLMILGAI